MRFLAVYTSSVRHAILGFFTVNQANAQCFNDFLNDVVAINVRRYQLQSINQSINQSFILIPCVKELKNSFKIRTCINKIYNNYNYIILFNF